MKRVVKLVVLATCVVPSAFLVDAVFLGNLDDRFGFLLWARCGDSDAAIDQSGPIEHVDCLSGLSISAHPDKGTTIEFSRSRIGQHVDGAHRAADGKEFPQILFVGIERDIIYIDILALGFGFKCHRCPLKGQFFWSQFQ